MARTDRRKFLESTGAAAGALMLSNATLRGAEQRKLRAGVIGVGWYGMVDARAALASGGVEVVAVCDADQDHLDKAVAELNKLQGKPAKTYKHYAKLLDHDGLDFVIIATPPHWHALQLLAALERGKDVYCEKPISYDVRAGQAMVAAVAGHPDRVVQVGFQRRQSRAFREATDFVKSGGIGKLVQVDAQIHYRAGLKDPTPQDPPATLDWDLWCGPGPKIPYSPQVGHKSWRLERTSGHGHLVDWGIHLVDSIRVFLELGMPKSITAAGGLYAYKDRITTPDTLSVHFEFDKVPVHWRHRIWGATEYTPQVNNGIFFFGTDGTVFASDRQWTVIRPGKNGAREEHSAPADLGKLHMADFLDAVRQRRRPSCVMSSAFQSTATVQLAMIAYETSSTVHWDETRAQITDNAAAAKLLKRPYRAPYQHPYTG